MGSENTDVLFKHVICLRGRWQHAEFPIQCVCVCACGLSVICVTGWLGLYEVRGQQELRKRDLLTSRSNRGESYCHNPALALLLSPTLEFMLSFLRLSPPVTFSSRSLFPTSCFTHFLHYTVVISWSVKTQKRRMFLGHGNARGILHLGHSELVAV